MDTRCWFIIFILSQFHSVYRRKFFANGDSFASIAQMKQIVDLEMKLGQSLERFVELEKSRLEKVKQFSKSVKEAMNQVQLEGPKSLENPATSYAVIKRFANGWTELGNFLEKDYSSGKDNHYTIRPNCFSVKCQRENIVWVGSFGLDLGRNDQTGPEFQLKRNCKFSFLSVSDFSRKSCGRIVYTNKQ